MVKYRRTRINNRQNPTFGLQYPPELQSKGHPIEEGGGKADHDGSGEEGAAEAGI